MVYSTDATAFENALKLGENPMIKVGTIEDIRGSPVDVAKLLASMGERSLAFIDDKKHGLLKKSYRIEIVQVEHPRWEFQLHIDPKYWFDMLYYIEAKDDEEKKAVIKTAREYVNSVRSSYRPSFPESSLPPKPSRTYCSTHSTCVSNKKTGPDYHQRYAEPKVFCIKNDVPQQNRMPRTCNWYAENERIVEEGKNYIILSRQEDVREILLVPTIHTTNRALVVKASFWKWILEYVINYFLMGFSNQQYPVERFAINFGTWESESAKDKYAVECHAHFHLHLNKEVVYAMEQKKDDKNEYLYESMHGKVNDPVQYGLKNCEELETSRLFGLEMVNINQGLADLNKNMDEMKILMQRILQSLPNSEPQNDNAVSN